MIQTLQAKEISLAQLSTHFGLERSDVSSFFPEWQQNLPELTNGEIQALEEVKQDYLHLEKYPLLEPIVKMVVLSPLLRLAGFYRPPFYLLAEKEVQLESYDDALLVRGRIDVLVFTPQFWVLVVEAKKAEFSLDAALPQALFYMLGQQEQTKARYGFVTNGSEFQFLKLEALPPEATEGTITPPPTSSSLSWQYGRSYPLSIYRGDDLQQVLRGLKQLGQQAASM